jgi:hypothetical protein
MERAIESEIEILMLLVLVAEVYLLDWTYSKFGLLRDSRLFISKQTDEKGPEDEIDRKVARTSPKDQYVRQMRGALTVLSKEFV